MLGDAGLKSPSNLRVPIQYIPQALAAQRPHGESWIGHLASIPLARCPIGPISYCTPTQDPIYWTQERGQMLRFSFFLLKSAFSLAGTGRALPFWNTKRYDSTCRVSYLVSRHFLIFSPMPPDPILRTLERPDALAAY
jgi:hypothetical protein